MRAAETTGGGRAIRVLLAAALAVGALLPALAPAQARAAQGVELTVGSKIDYDSYCTTWFEADGQPAWCANPSKASPDAGTYDKQPLSTPSGRDAEMAADMWFAYGSPGFDRSLWPGSWHDGSAMTPGRYMALAHILLSDTYASDGEYAMFGCTEGFRDWVRWNVIGFGSDGSPINEGATGRRILARAAEVPSTFEPFLLYTGSSTQVIASFTYHTTVRVAKKVSEGWAQADPDYTLAGAVYGVYASRADAEADRNRLTTITTDASGAGESGSLGATRDTFWAKELKPSAGYALDEGVYEVGPSNDYAFASVEPPLTVRLVLKKFDAETGHGSPQGDAVLDGALYQARYVRGSATETVKGETVGATVVFEGIPLGDIEVRELSPSGGYLLDRDVHRIRVTADMAQGTSPVIEVQPQGEFGEQVQRGGILIGKGDAERYEHEDGDFWSYAQGDATFEGAEFTVYNRSASPVWHDSSGDGRFQASEEFAPGDAVMTIATEYNESLDAWTATTGVRALPFGTYEIVETKAPVGYTGEGIVSHVVEIREDGQFDQLVEADGMLNEVVRGGVQVQKDDLELGTSEALGGADHSALSDEGYIDTSDVVEGSGIWFGQGEDGSVAAPDDKLGALPFGEYRIQELRCEANEGYTLWEDTFNVSRDTTATDLDIDLGTVDDQPMPRLGTEATDKADGDHMIAPEGKVTVVDEVAYANLVPGKAYTVKGTLMDKATGEPLVVNGAEVTSEREFAPIAPLGTVKVEFTFDASALAEKEIVVFESLLREGIEIASHADIHDEGQTVKVEPAPEIGTVATDAADGDHEASADSTVRIEDQVFYSGLVPGAAYAVKGKLVDKATGEDLFLGGSPVEGEAQFSPSSANGFETVSFEFDGTGLEGKDIVIYEYLYREGKLVCEHADIDNANQTVRMTEPVPEIDTTATDAEDGDHEAEADADVTVVDEVRYENLEPGREYVLTGTLIDKTIAKPVEKDGLPLISVVAFTPAEPNGSVEVTFAFDGSALAGHRTVAFESLALDGEVVAVHEDIHDEGQSVDIVEKPSPDIPKAKLAQTGDTNNIVPLVCLAAMAALIAALAALRERCRRRKDSSEAEEAKEDDLGEEGVPQET